MTTPGPAFQECTGSCHENVSAPKAVLAQIEIVPILVHYQPSYNTSHTMKPSVLADGTLCCGMYPASKVDISQHNNKKYSRPPDIKSSSNVSLPFAWITGPATDPS